MTCQHYQEWIEEAAAGAIAGRGSDSRRAQLDAHLDACPECRRALEAARELYAAINQGIATRVEGVPAGDFAARVRMRLAEEGERAEVRSWWRRSIWIPALGSVALALLILSIWIARRPGGQRLQPPKQQVARAVSPSPEGLGAKGQGSRAGGQGSVARGQGPRPRSSRSQRQSAPGSEAPQLQVQIQPGQWAAVTSLYRAGQSGALKGITVASTTADEPLQVKPVEVPPLVIAEIQDPKPVESEPENTNVQDR